VKAVFLDYATLGEADLSQIEARCRLQCFETTPAQSVVERARECEIVITNKVVLDSDTLDNLPNLKLICVAATGYNNIDIEACKKRGVAVCNAAGYSTASVVQTVFATLFSHISKISFFDNFVKSGAYAASPIFTCMDREFWEISGKKFGVIGLGEIGSCVLRAAKAFGCESAYYSTSGQNSSDEFARLSLDELLRECDIISIHCSLNEKTKNLIGYDELKKLKKSAILMNFARGGVVDEEGCKEALLQECFELYVCDVFTKEPIAPHSPLLAKEIKDKLLLTPHIAWASKQARDRLVSIIASNIKAFLDGAHQNRIC